MVKEIYYCDICGKEYISPESMRIIHIDTGNLQTCARRDMLI